MNKEQEELSKKLNVKLNVLISLSLRLLLNDKDFVKKGKKGTGDVVSYLARMGLDDAREISDILGAPLQSVRTFLTPKRRKK